MERFWAAGEALSLDQAVIEARDVMSEAMSKLTSVSSLTD